MKKPSTAKIVGLLLAGSVAVVSLTGAAGAGAPADAPAAKITWKFVSVPSHQAAAPEAKQGEATSLLDPGTIGLCNAGFGDVSVQSWDNDLGHIDLFCGDGASGYIHIRDGGDNEVGHQDEWQAFADEASPPIDWDDLMVGAAGDAILTDKTPTNQGNQKLCYTSTVELTDDDTGRVVDTIQPTIIVSSNNKLVITAYPTHYESEC
ncbi:hypothetical protein [Agreia sp. COWG]|uniref:hypothetical protein n=1 Tax=Agreia sp. COWG TaxID=2773266 RepID=UPI0019273476|nr:hypothetical protein [Agreia sp. COWG]